MRRRTDSVPRSDLIAPRKLASLAVLATLAGVIAGSAAPAHAAGSAPAASTQGGPFARPSVVAVKRVAPARRKVIRHRFDPWDRPSAAKVRQIIRIEARRWHIDPRRLSRRVSCESRYRWWAGNGPYKGLLQFHSSTFARGLRTIRDRRVTIVRERYRTVREKRYVHYSDGHVERRLGRRHRQRVVTIYRGVIPRHPGLTHAWAQLRIGAQSIRGISAVHSSEWSCGA